MLLKTNTVNWSTYNKQYVKINKSKESKLKILNIINNVLRLLGKEPIKIMDLNDKSSDLSPAMVDSVLWEYMVDLLLDTWNDNISNIKMLRDYDEQDNRVDSLRSIISETFVKKIKSSLDTIE